MPIVIILLGIGISEIVYTVYKKMKNEKPSGVTLFAVLTPIIGSVISCVFYYNSGWLSLLKGFALFTIITILIPLNFIGIKNGFSRTIKTTKSGVSEFRGFFKEQKDKEDKFKEAWEQHKKESEDDKPEDTDKKE